MLLPLGVIALVGACAPYPPQPYPPHPPQTLPADPDGQQSLTDEQQRQLDESRERLRLQQEAAQNQENLPVAPTPNKPQYPTAAAVPGKAGFVFNPYTHNIVDVRGIASGKLCRDPEDSDSTHKFRVP
ncbi:MAG: hypothetical protein KJO21_05000 [Verrucomicrobiae bacterium]|nr:hypothetical protein [Verrucomicrobiae bacterium]NNJ43081.1 hypothetical protein [Akkermansiaceae bacterium]